MEKIKVILFSLCAAMASSLCAETVGAEEDDLLAITKLLAIPSVSSDIAQCDRATEFVRSYLESRGVWCAVETAPDGRKVLYAATKKNLKEPDFTLITHIDVVDGAPGQFEPKIKDGRLYARGACDTKGNAFCAMKALVALNGKASVGCVFCSDEEIGGRSCAYMVERGYAKPGKFMFVLDAASPSTDISYCCKGCVYYRVTARGVSGHASLPMRCDNPIYKIAQAALKLQNEFPQEKPGEWGDVMAVTVINSGDALNRIPEIAEMTVNVRFVTKDGIERNRALIEKITGLKTEVIRGSPAILGNENDPMLKKVAKILKVAYPERPCKIVRGNGANDSRHFARYGKTYASFGMNHAGGHSDCEWLEIADIPHFTRVLVDMLSQD